MTDEDRRRHLLALDMERYGHVAKWNDQVLAGTHNYSGGSCPHRDCGASGMGDVSGYQCAGCGHYFPRNRVAMGDDSEPYCRLGMGHNYQGNRMSLSNSFNGLDESDLDATMAASFLPMTDRYGPALPCVVIEGVQVYVYVKDGRLRVSVDLDTAGEGSLVASEDECVPMRIDVGVDTVFEADKQGQETR